MYNALLLYFMYFEYKWNKREINNNKLAERRPYTYKEELANTLSHGFGVILGLVAGYFLLSKALMTHDAWKISSVIIYLFGALASYVTSTLYHG